MPYELFWIADDPAIARPAASERLSTAELLPLRRLLAALATVTTRAELLEVIGRCVEGVIGGSTFGVLERPSGRGVTTLLWARGDETLLRRSAAHARVRETLRYGTSHVRHAVPGEGSPSGAAEPVASIPLWGMGGNVCGALVLAELLPPKCQLDRQDQRFLTLLASEGGRLLCTLPADDRTQGVA